MAAILESGRLPPENACGGRRDGTGTGAANMARVLARIGVAVLVLAAGGALAFAADDGPSAGPSPRTLKRAVSQKKARSKKAAGKPAPAEDATPKSDAPASDGESKFSRDVAPIFVANCLGCHNPAQKRKKLDLSTFEAIMAGTPDEKVIVPGKPVESHLVLRIKGIETPKMPQGGNRTLSDEAVARVERWVKAGAILDAGIDPKAPLSKYAATPDDLRKNDLAKLTPDQRDKQVEASGLERWKKASPKVKPDVTPSAHFVLFGTLPKARATAALRVLETQFTALKPVAGPAALEWGEKASVYVLNDASSFNEFVRVIEAREVESGETTSAKFTGPQPYVVAVDPLGGRDEPATAPKRGGRGRSGDGASAGLSLGGVLTEPFAAGVLSRAGKPPRWLTLGLGSYLASKADPKSPYFQKLRSRALDLCQQGWATRASDALGDATKTEDVRAVGFAVVEWLNATDRSLLPIFAKGMLGGGQNLDAVIEQVLQGNRDEFLAGSGTFVSTHYGPGR